MKYIKKYEGNNQNRFWKVKTTIPEFAISLDKIGIPENKKIDFLKRENSNNVTRYDYVYVGVEYYPSAISGIWTWDEDSYGHARYMGEIEITPEDIEKWNFNNDINKYNL